jgi:hypothetical protein
MQKVILIIVLLNSIGFNIYGYEQQTIDQQYGKPSIVDIKNLPTGWEMKRTPNYDSQGRARGEFNYDSTHIFIDHISKAKIKEEMATYKASNPTPVKPQPYYILSESGHNNTTTEIEYIKNGYQAKVQTAQYVYLPTTKQICTNDKFTSVGNDWYEMRFNSYYYYFQAKGAANVNMDSDLFENSKLTSVPLSPTYAICWDKPISADELLTKGRFDTQDKLSYLFNNDQFGDSMVQFKVCTQLSNTKFNENVDGSVLDQIRNTVKKVEKSNTSQNINPQIKEDFSNNIARKNIEDPYKDQYVTLKYIVHCDKHSEFIGSEIPTPELFNEYEQVAGEAWFHYIKGRSIYKNFKIKLQVKEYKGCDNFFDKLLFRSEDKEYTNLQNGIENVNNYLYKVRPLVDEEMSIQTVEELSENQLKSKIQKKGDWWFGLKDFTGTKFEDNDKLYARTRINGSFNLSNLENFKGSNINFEYKDDKKFKFLEYINESAKSNEINFMNAKKTIDSGDKDTDIEATMIVKGDRSDRDRIRDIIGPFTDNPIITVDENQSLKFKLLNSNASKTKYNSLSELWIISHGYRDNFNFEFEKIGKQILVNHPNDIVIGLDWSNIATINANPVEQASYDICRVPTWIKPISEVIHQRLNNWGFKNGTKLNLIGHSLGTLMSAEISQRFIDYNQNQANKMILLDPPSETRCKLNLKQYTVQQNPEVVKVDKFANRANYTYAFVGNHSLAGNQQLASTAHRSYWMEYGSWFDLGNEHSAVVSTFEILNRSDKITNNKKTLKDYYPPKT